VDGMVRSCWIELSLGFVLELGLGVRLELGLGLVEMGAKGNAIVGGGGGCGGVPIVVPIVVVVAPFVVAVAPFVATPRQ